MKHIARMPLFLLCGSFAATAFFLSSQDEAKRMGFILIPAVFLVFFGILRLLFPSDKRPSLLPVLPILLGLLGGGLSSWLYFDHQVAAILKQSGETGVITAKITEVSYASEYTTIFLVKASTWQGESTKFGAVLDIPAACEAEV